MWNPQTQLALRDSGKFFLHERHLLSYPRASYGQSKFGRSLPCLRYIDCQRQFTLASGNDARLNSTRARKINIRTRENYESVVNTSNCVVAAESRASELSPSFCVLKLSLYERDGRHHELRSGMVGRGGGGGLSRFGGVVDERVSF